MFGRLGVPVLYADQIAREISDTEPRVKRAIVRLLGPESYRSDGKLDRPFVASKVFSKKTLQQKLNAIVHPEVEKELKKRIQKLEGNRVPFVIVEAALIYEAELDKMLDAVIVVDADESTRTRRVMERDNVTGEEVQKRINAQWSQQKKVQRADYVIMNDGSLSDLELKIKFLSTLFTHLYQ